MNHILIRTRIKEPINSVFQMHRNTRIDPHSIDFLTKLNNIDLHRYPIIEDFKEKYATYLGVNPNNILLTSGVDGAIRSIYELFGQNSTVAFLEPSYAMYRVYASAYKSNVISITPNSKNFKVNLNDILNVCKKSKILFIQNPNAPIENIFTINEISQIAKLADMLNFVLFIDEAYYGFGAPTFINMVKKYKNVFVARSFSKWFGLPSIRLGCIISNPTKILELETYRLAYETNKLSMLIAEVALENLEYFQNYSKEINKSRQLIKNEMTKFKIKTHGNLSNNILLKSDLNLEKEGILVKQNIPYPANNWMSVTLGSIQAALIFINAFKKCGY